MFCSKQVSDQCVLSTDLCYVRPWIICLKGRISSQHRLRRRQLPLLHLDKRNCIFICICILFVFEFVFVSVFVFVFVGIRFCTRTKEIPSKYTACTGTIQGNIQHCARTKEIPWKYTARLPACLNVHS